MARAGRAAGATPPARTFSFPHRDASGRVVSMVELTTVALVGIVIALAAVVVVDGITSLLGLGDFGGASGWLTLILPGLIFFDDLRAWAGYSIRFVVAIVGAAAAIGVGLVVASLANSWPPVISGALGAAAAVIVYSPIWYFGVRWLTGDSHGEAA